MLAMARILRASWMPSIGYLCPCEARVRTRPESAGSLLERRWRPLCIWKHGNSVEDALARAIDALKNLAREQWAEKFSERRARNLS